MGNNIIIKNVNKYYGKKQVLFDLNLTIEQGMFGLLGRNGAGKTTLMKLISALHEKKSGSISICGFPVEQAREIRNITGYLPQDFSMYPSMTVYEAIDYLGVLSELPASVRKERIPDMLNRVNLTDKQHVKIKNLSGGMKRRLGIAQALLHNPKVLIVDEPTAGLDPEERIRFRNLLCEVASERIVILSTHIVGDIEATCEKIAIMNEGTILYNGTVNGLLHNAEGKVYAVQVPNNLVPQLKKDYLVTAMHLQQNGTDLRILSDKNPSIQNCTPVIPNVEDAYMVCLYENGCRFEGGAL